jgi:sialidase-1
METAEAVTQKMAAERARNEKAEAEAAAKAIARVKKEANAKAKPFFEFKPLLRPAKSVNIIAVKDGEILAFGAACTHYRRSSDSGATWTDDQKSPGVGNVVFDKTTGEVILISHSGYVWRSEDNGRTWSERETVEIRPNPINHGGSDRTKCKVGGSIDAMESGITLEHGKYKGRLICPIRIKNQHPGKAQYWWWHYNTAVYSDDHGKTWQIGGPVQSGTGEGTLAELSDGRIYYNSRSHMSTDNRRQIAWSHNGGQYFVDWSVEDDLREPGQPAYFRHCRVPSYGVSAGLARLPSHCSAEKDILLFSMPDDPGGRRRRLTVFASLDGGKTWPVKRLIDKGGAAYSAMEAGPDGMIYVLCHTGRRVAKLARFNTSWLLEEYDENGVKKT